MLLSLKVKLEAGRKQSLDQLTMRSEKEILVTKHPSDTNHYKVSKTRY